MKRPESEDLLSATARSVGHAAGKVAKALGIEEPAKPTPAKAKGPKKTEGKPKSRKRVSARSTRIGRAAAAKKEAIASKAGGAAGDIRFRRIMGKTPAAWSDADVNYVEGLTSSKKQAAPA